MSNTVRLFIGSSTEGLEIAEHLQFQLRRDCESTVWSQGVFELSQETLQNLLKASFEYDFAAFVLTPDDKTIKRGKLRKVARDNLLFEIGLFMGSVGQGRTFIIHCEDDNIDIPSDLIGVTRAIYKRSLYNDLRASLGPVATQIKGAIKKITDSPEWANSHTDALYDFLKRIINLHSDSISDSDLHLFYLKKMLTIAQLKELGREIQNSKT